MTRTAAEMNKGITSALEKMCLFYVVEIMHVTNGSPKISSVISGNIPSCIHQHTS